MNKYIKKYDINILILIYTVGIIAHFTPFAALSLSMTPIVLILTNLVVFYHTQRNLGAIALVFLLGMLVEIIGVQTGYPFGNYYYTDALSIKVLGVPLIIGLNWVLVSQLALSFIPGHNKVVIFVLGGLITTLFDFLIEPLAIAYKWWVWTDVVGSVPVQNYIAWFLIGGVASLLIRKNKIKDAKKLRWVMLIMVLFFLLNHAFIYWKI